MTTVGRLTEGCSLKKPPPYLENVSNINTSFVEIV